MRNDAPGRTPISLCVIAFNEEANIRECLESAAFADELLVVDSGSTDRTAEIARESGARVLVQPFLGHVEQKNFAVDAARFDWILSLDADERLSPELAASIRDAMGKPQPDADGFVMNRRMHYLGEWFKEGGWYPDKRIRLFRRPKGRWAGVNPHDGVRVDGRVLPLEGDILHYSFRDLDHHTAVINRYTTISSREFHARGARWVRTRMLLAPAARFIKNYVLQGAWKRGSRGFIMAVQAAYYVFLKYAKLWELGRGEGRDRTGGDLGHR